MDNYAIIPSWAIKRLIELNEPFSWVVYCSISTYLKNPGGVAAIQLDELASKIGLEYRTVRWVAMELENKGLIQMTREGWYLPWNDPQKPQIMKIELKEKTD